MWYVHIVITAFGTTPSWWIGSDLGGEEDACHLEVDECPEHNFKLEGYTLGPFATWDEANSWGHGAGRCQKRTGVALDDLPVEELSDGDTPPGKILCGGSVPGATLFVCTGGEPDHEDEDGVEYWNPVPENFTLVKVKSP